MATIYASERAKYGNLTGQVIVWPMEINPDINSITNRQNLPSGYLRCDGTIYNVVDYPQLAAICGVGVTGKFVRKSLNGTALQTLTDDQFVVPDLGSKYPKPTPGADAGQYKSIREVNSVNNEVSRSGIGIEATSSLGTSINVTYEGTFTIPAQSIALRGRPAWTWGTTGGRQTESEVVDSSGLAGHMHFFNGKRTRLKSTNETDPTAPASIKDPQAIGAVAYWNGSTIPIDDWMTATKEAGNSANTFRGNNQPPCRAMASNHYARNYQFYFGAFAGTWNPVTYSDGCYNGGALLETDFKYQCLLTPDGGNGWQNYPIGSDNFLVQGLTPHSSNAYFPIVTCVVQNANQRISTNQNVNWNYGSGASGVPNDWKSASMHDVLPLNSNLSIDSSRIYGSLFNNFTESDDLVRTSDPTAHFHRVNLNKGTHTFTLVTNPLELSPDALKTTLNLSVDAAVSIDNQLSPFIVLEYLIKI